MFEKVTKAKVRGHVLIKDKETGEVLVDKENAIHYENFSIALAKSISHRDEGWMHEMAFGNGAATVNGIGVVTYLPPNITSQSASLYGQTYAKVIDDNSPLNNAPDKNFIEINHAANQLYTDLVITCTLDFGEPAGESAFDASTSNEAAYVFDEMGIRAFSETGDGLLLTHVIFHPVQKALNRIIEIIYTIRILMT